jgi:protein-arginine kinase activator protein McsA
MITLIGRNTNKIQNSIDNIYMNDEDIEKIASRVAELLYQKAQENVDNDSFKIPKEDQEQMLLAELARLMTLLSSYLEREEYDKCAILQNKIKIIEKKIERL